MPKLTINGQSVEVDAGASVIQAAQKINIPIAHYCWHEALSVAGACRMCLVEVEKNPKLQIACNLPVTEGMVVHTDSEKVKDAVRWSLDFHLINHPLDCPICDQAGECKLQDYYMNYGLYNPEMDQRKVKKHKVLSLGDRVVLDQERCILCSRCVRFTSEVSKTHELGIFNRGDRSVIGTFENRPLNNKYSVNTVDICPVGALTSKDFRFKQRVWFLKDFESVCNGCSTGCNVTVSYNATGVFRVKPRLNKDVNGYWMCDEGRDIYKHSNKEYRLTEVVEKRSDLNGATMKGKPVALALQEVGHELKKQIAKDSNQVGVVLTGQYTSEEYDSFFEMFSKKLSVKNFYHWKNQEESFETFDGLLLRGDKNPNTAGLLKSAQKNGIKLLSLKDLESKTQKNELSLLVVAAPENLAVYTDLQKSTDIFKKISNVVWITACNNASFSDFKWLIPAKSFVEKSGTFVNYKGMEQKIKDGVRIVEKSISLQEFSKGIQESLGVSL